MTPMNWAVTAWGLKPRWGVPRRRRWSDHPRGTNRRRQHKDRRADDHWRPDHHRRWQRDADANAHVDSGGRHHQSSGQHGCYKQQFFHTSLRRRSTRILRVGGKVLIFKF